MAKVFLRVYNHEIEGMIEGGQLDEAVAHCQQILKTFPMHVETYRLLGKTFLEARRYADAADIFQRILMTVPDDFVAHVGMSIIRDDEGKLDDAIWHMERAFEVQPSNPAIQGELRRLYGRRDGVEPSKIRLSRDALANMYSQGELFNQAIAEIRSVLAEDPARPDLQVMLARAYYRAGQKVEAAEMSAALLKKYTFCMDALRILVDVLPGTARAENTQVYRQRLCLLDPYSNFVADSAFASDQVADSAVSLEQLEYKAGAIPAASQPDWASSLGIKLGGEKRAEPLPSWVKAAETGETTQATEQPSSIAPETASAPAAAADSVPDWMRSAGWQESTGAAQAGPLDSSEELPAEPIPHAEIPDWLKSMAPPGVTDAAEAEPEEADEPLPVGGNDMPDWLKSMAPPGVTSAANAKPEEPAAPLPKGADDMPDWLKSVAPPEVTGTANVKPEEPAAPLSAGEDDMPRWRNSTDSSDGTGAANIKPEEPAAPLPTGDDDMPDWLKSMAPSEVAGTANAEPAPAPVAETPPVNAIPEPVPTQPPSTEAKTEPAPAAPPTAAEAGALPDWLMDLGGGVAAGVAAVSAQSQAAEQPVTPEPLQTTEQTVVPERAQTEEQPIMPEPVAQEPTIPAVSASGLGDEPSRPQGQGKPLEIGDDALGWLESLAAKQGAKPEELLTNPQERSAEMPEWLRQAGEQPPAKQEPKTTPRETLPLEPFTPLVEKPALAAVPVPVETAPVSEEMPPAQPPAEEEPQPVTIENDTMAWLNQLAVDQGTKPEESWTPPEGLPESVSEGAQELSEEQPVAPTPAESGPVMPASEGEDITITSWLSRLDGESAGKVPPVSASQEQPATPAGELPDWLKDFEKPVAPAESPKADEDLPEWLRQPAAPPASEPVVQMPAPEPEMPAWVDENAPVSEQAAPTAPGEWVPAEGPAAGPGVMPVAETPAAAVRKSVQPPIIKGTGMLAPIPAQNKEAQLLSGAQTALEGNSSNDAMKEYGKLIKKGCLLDEVIHDLREAIYRFPVDVIVWQTLGDAYMRANRLQDALDAYTKAEELLR